MTNTNTANTAAISILNNISSLKFQGIIEEYMIPFENRGKTERILNFVSRKVETCFPKGFYEGLSKDESLAREIDNHIPKYMENAEFVFPEFTSQKEGAIFLHMLFKRWRKVSGRYIHLLRGCHSSQEDRVVICNGCPGMEKLRRVLISTLGEDWKHLPFIKTAHGYDSDTECFFEIEDLKNFAYSS